jgi:hypothetical protein
MGINFIEWLIKNEMAAMTSYRFGRQIANLDTKDGAGLKHMARPGFRDSDRNYIVRDSPLVEKKLTNACEKYGIHWIIGYLEPPAEMQEENPEDWAKYDKQAKKKGEKLLSQFNKNFNRFSTVVPIDPPNPENTIVYIKPTSRAHGLTPHEQIHNMGHALWLHNPQQMQHAKEVLIDAVKRLQQSAYEADPNAAPPTEAEITVIMARLIDLYSAQKVLVLKTGDLDSTVKTALTAFNAYDELIFDLIPAFMNAGGQINLYPRGVGKIYKKDRVSAIEPNPEVVAKKQVRPWVWKKMASDRQAWSEVSKMMTSIVVNCLKNSVWAKQGGPIYPYQKLTTKA